MTLQDQILDSLGKQMAKSIDDDVMMSMMGWKEYQLVIDEGRVYGARYLTAHPTNSDRWNEMMEWMINTFGPSAVDGVWTPGMRWYANGAKFWFRNQKDLDWFVLRWSS